MATGIYIRTPSMYASRRGRKHSKEHREKIGHALRGRKYPGRGKGKILSREHRQKIREAKFGSKASPETIRKLRESHLGYVMPEEQKRKISIANKGGNRTTFRKGHRTWNRDKKMPELSNENNPGWKGENVSYFGLHAWVARKLGKPRECSHCGTKEARVYHWANISREYKRDLGDWIRLCIKCHDKYDQKYRQENPPAIKGSPSVLRGSRGRTK